MKRSTIWIVVGVAAAVAVLVIVLPLLGLAIFFRSEIGDWVAGSSVDRTSGTHLAYVMQPVTRDASLPEAAAVKQSILRRIDPKGRWGCEVAVRPPFVDVQVPGDAARADAVKRLLSRVGHLEFRIVADNVKDRGKADFDRIIRMKQEGRPPEGSRWRWCRLGRGWQWYKSPRGNLLEAWNFVYVVDEAKQEVEALVNVADGQNVTGEDLASAWVGLSEEQPVISFKLKPQAAARFSRLTSPENRDRQLAIILDDVVQSAPSLRATLTTAGIIEGYESRQELEEVVDVLNSGELGCRLGAPVREEPYGRGSP